MDRMALRELLAAVAEGGLAPDEAARRLETLPFENLGFARVDHHRSLRCGFPEVIFCAGKTPDQVLAIARSLREGGERVRLGIAAA